MDSIFVTHKTADAVPIWFVTAANYKDVRKVIGAEARAFADAAGFEPKSGRYLPLPGKSDDEARLGGVLFGLEGADDTKDPFLPGRLPQHLPDGVYRFANEPHDARLAALAFALGSYRFTRYRKTETRAIKLDLPQSIDRDELQHIVEAVTLARDLINTPANDMGPAQLEQAARKLAARHNATITAIIGDELLEKNFPLIHAVGRAAAGEPRLIDMLWGDAKHPRVTLVGKGVCFDTGGLDIKPDASMLNMKKDMGGAATALALAHMIMSRKLKVRLRVLIPAVENSIAGSSFRPRDIYTSRKGITVEIGNTDAEGRLMLADALALADEDKPELIADFATLTGAARVALGPDVPAFFTDDDRARRRSDELRRRRERSGVAAAVVAALRGDARVESRRHQQCRRQPGRRHHRRFVHAPFRDGEVVAALRRVRLDGVRPKPAGRKAATCSRRARSMRCSRRATVSDGRVRSSRYAGARRSRGQASARQSHGVALCRGPRDGGDRAAGAAPPRAAARRAARHRSAQGRARHDLRHKRRRGLPGGSSRPTIMSAGCRRMRLRPRALRQRIRSRRCGLSRFRAPRSNCRPSRRCRSARRLPSRVSPIAWR